MIRETYSEDNLRDVARKFRNIVLWGLLPFEQHSHGFIFLGYFLVAKKVGLKIAWLQESEANLQEISSDDVVFIHGSTNNLIDGVLLRNPYIVDMHIDLNEDRLGTTVNRVREYEKRLTEREYYEDEEIDPDAVRLDLLTTYSSHRRILAQPWGADLLPS